MMQLKEVIYCRKSSALCFLRRCFSFSIITLCVGGVAGACHLRKFMQIYPSDSSIYYWIIFVFFSLLLLLM